MDAEQRIKELEQRVAVLESKFKHSQVSNIDKFVKKLIEKLSKLQLKS